MFSWKNDKKVLTEGPFEFRINENKNVNMKSLIEPFYYQFLNKE
jgi:hypothetical protein